MNHLEQPQLVCTIKLWYQLFFRGHFRVGGVLYGITRKIEVCVHQNVMFLMINIHIEKHYYNF